MRTSRPSSLLLPVAVIVAMLPGRAAGDCWTVEDERGLLAQAICSQNIPAFDSVPRDLNRTVSDLRLNRNKIAEVSRESLARYTELRYLDLSRNHIGRIEDSAFSAQSQLLVLRLGNNRLALVTALTFSGLPRLRELYLQANAIKSVAPHALRGTGTLLSLDLAANRLSALEPSAIDGPRGLAALDLQGNPFHCSCALLPLAGWLAARYPTEEPGSVWERMQCATPHEARGRPIFRPGGGAAARLAESCVPGERGEGVGGTGGDADGGAGGGGGANGSGDSRRRQEGEAASFGSGWGPADGGGGPAGNPPPGKTSAGAPAGTPAGGAPSAGDERAEEGPTLRLMRHGRSSATLRVVLPRPFGRMYMLVRYAAGAASPGWDVCALRYQREDVTDERLAPARHYTYCVVSVTHGARRTNHSCVSFTTAGGRDDGVGAAGASGAPPLALVAAACALAALLAAASCFCCCRSMVRGRRKRRRADSRDLRGVSTRWDPAPRDPGTRDPGLRDPPATRGPGPGDGDVGGAGLEEPGDGFSPVGAGRERPKAKAAPGEGGGSASYLEVAQGVGAPEISTIAREVDRVNSIINSCIDALRADSPFGATGAGGGGAAGGPDADTTGPRQDDDSPACAPLLGPAGAAQPPRATCSHGQDRPPLLPVCEALLLDEGSPAAHGGGGGGRRTAPSARHSLAWHARGLWRRLSGGGGRAGAAAPRGPAIPAGRALQHKVHLVRHNELGDLLDVLEYWKAAGATDRTPRAPVGSWKY
ncbi:uncharacterized protein LOC144950466 [Lampetra fluviatilis]